MEQIWSWIVLAVLVLGTAGTLLPILPGLPVMALAVVGYGWLAGYEKVGSGLIALTIALAVCGTFLDYISGPYTAKKTGASRSGVWGAVIGGVAGVLVMGPVGLLLGPFVGAVIGELLFGKSLGQASKTGVASVAGFLIGSVIKFIFALVITISFFIKVII